MSQKKTPAFTPQDVLPGPKIRKDLGDLLPESGGMIQMHQMAQELAAIPGAENRHDVTRELIETALTGNGLKAQNLSVNDGIVRAQFAGVAMSGLQAWLLELQKSSALFVEEIKITAQEGGLVNASLSLRQSVAGGSN